jgi:hypothetical protein
VAVEDEVEEDEASDEPDYPDDVDPLPPSERADTAALLRELASLGLEDEAPAPPMRSAAAAASRPVPNQPAQKKRKGLFGR